MKKFLLCLFAAAFATASLAQSPNAFSKKEIEKCRWADYASQVQAVPGSNLGVNPTVQPPNRDINDYQVGVTMYDKQSNFMVSNRIYFYPEDMSTACVWTKGHVPEEFNDRGTGYNFFDGSGWLPEPNGRIEDQKTGWPTYAPWGPEGEMVVAHLDQGLIMSTRPVRGTGDWTVTEILDEPADPTWARIVTSGEDHQTIHVLASSYDAYMGQDKALLYFRSPDGGVTWDIPGIILDGTGSDFYTFVQQDSYAWAEPKGNTLAFISCSLWHDMFMMKSTDGGDTWEKTVSWEHTYPFFDFDVTLTDTFFCVDNSAAITLDDQGKAHVAFGISRALHNETGTGYWVFYLVDGIGYWNEDMETFSNDIDALCPPQYEWPDSELIEDQNYVGWTQDVDGDGEVTFLQDFYYYNTQGVSTMPAITIDEMGRIFIVFASTTETYDNFQYNYKHIWARAFNEEAGWTAFVHVSSDIIHMFDECVYPVLAGNSNGYLHMFYQADATPGTALDEDHLYQENRITFSRINKYEFYPWEIDEPMKPGFSVSQNYPNPFTEVSYIRVEMASPGNLMLQVSDLTGKKIMETDKGYVPSGSHIFNVDGSRLSRGVYFYTILSGDQSVSGKMVVK